LFKGELKYINTDSLFYKEAVAIRKELFFKNMENSTSLIQDNFEENGIHVVCLNDNKVVGTGRMNVVKSTCQNQGVGSKILKALIEKSKEKGLSKIKLSARKTAISFYEKFNFKPCGNQYPSKKTGIIHQEMELKIKQ
jgi:predicted N-acetyltransferase YhbS